MPANRENGSVYNPVSIDAGNGDIYQIDRSPSIITDRLAAVLAHEIKTPLTSIKLNVDMISEDESIPENRKQSLRIIQKEINRLGNLVNKFMHFAGFSELSFAPVDIRALTEEVRTLVAPVAEKKDVVIINKVERFILSADREKLFSALLNIISNSIDAIKEKGEIELSSALTEGRYSILLKDDGEGIENGNEIFEPFYTTKPEGTGLGLLIAAEIISKHNGELKLVSSRKGETIFKITFLL